MISVDCVQPIGRFASDAGQARSCANHHRGLPYSRARCACRSRTIRAPSAGCGALRRQARVPGAVSGAALHYLDGTNGVKDFDVWSFYAERGDGPFPYRWRGTADYGPSKFGRYPDDPPSFTGRRVDCSGDRSTCRLTPNRPKFCMTISLQRGPALRKNWRQKRPSSSTPNSSPVRSSGLRPVPRDDILIWLICG